MGENSKIEWCDHTFNPWMGCTKVSQGCKHCYAESQMDKHYRKVQWGPAGKRVRTSKDNWRKPIQWNKWAKEKGIRYRVFCASLADVFEDKPDQPEMDDWRADLMRIIAATPNLDWLLLTKRPENVVSKVLKAIKLIHSDGSADDVMTAMTWLGWVKHGADYLPNVWVGTSVEDQEAADKRIPELLKIPAHVKFLSMEPLLGQVDLSLVTQADGFEVITDTLRGTTSIDGQAHLPGPSINWVIVGGESGNQARPMHPDWVRSIRDQCVSANVPFLFKQWGEFSEFNCTKGMAESSRETGFVHRDGRYWEMKKKTKSFEGDISDVCMVMNIGKHATGRLLDGVEWNQFPK